MLLTWSRAARRRQILGKRLVISSTLLLFRALKVISDTKGRLTHYTLPLCTGNRDEFSYGITLRWGEPRVDTVRSDHGTSEAAKFRGERFSAPRHKCFVLLSSRP